VTVGEVLEDSDGLGLRLVSEQPEEEDAETVPFLGAVLAQCSQPCHLVNHSSQNPRGFVKSGS
jgi:hypothetical protein